MSDLNPRDTPDLVGPVMEKLGYTQPPKGSRSSGVRITIRAVAFAGILSMISLFVLSLAMPSGSARDADGHSEDLISKAILQSRQDVARIGDAIVRLQTVGQPSQNAMGAEIEGAGIESISVGEVLMSGEEDDIEQSVDLEATFRGDDRYEDIAAREAE